MKVRYSKK